VGKEGSELLGALTKAAPGGLATDANGDAWVIDDASVLHYKSGDPVSFAKDVKPFFAAHCASCHKEGAEGAPKHDFEDFATATEYAESIAKKLTAPPGMGVMPPASVETLGASDYAVVIRWIGSGQAP
jgi:cytochrome c5